MYNVRYTGQSSRDKVDRSGTLLGAKRLGTKNAEYGMDITILDDSDRAIWHKEFWSVGNNFGWNNWVEI